MNIMYVMYNVPDTAVDFHVPDIGSDCRSHEKYTNFRIINKGAASTQGRLGARTPDPMSTCTLRPSSFRFDISAQVGVR